ncbi:MAG: sugar isomerase domain-containing protein [Proteobacteria bacterium]|nr:sugar isomerase domain-containing protein [Pseudomonadota bacterium]
MSAPRWFARCDEILERIRTTQLDAIRQVAQLIAEAAQDGGGLHFYDTGHCSREAVHRAGGLCMLNHLTFSFDLDTRVAPKRAEQVAARQRAGRAASDEKLAALAVARSALAPGDVLLISSVSGRAATTVEVARAARDMGVHVAAITNVTYSRAVESTHTSGKRLFEMAEVAIDNCGVVGDGALDMEGLDTGVAPTSGVAFCYIIWAVVSEAVAQMQARGLKPHVYRSVNLPDGEQFNARAEAEYAETGV